MVPEPSREVAKAGKNGSRSSRPKRVPRSHPFQSRRIQPGPTYGPLVVSSSIIGTSRFSEPPANGLPQLLNFSRGGGTRKTPDGSFALSEHDPAGPQDYVHSCASPEGEGTRGEHYKRTANGLSVYGPGDNQVYIKFCGSFCFCIYLCILSCIYIIFYCCWTFVVSVFICIG